MLRLAIDECVDNDIVRGVLRMSATVDFVRVQDAGLTGADDPTVLAWAAREKRVLVTHDLATMIRFAYERVSRDEPMPGLPAIRSGSPIRAAIDDLVLIIECSEDGELEGRVLHLPFA